MFSIGDLIQIVPANNVSGYAASYIRPLLTKAGIIIDIQMFELGQDNNPKCYYTTLIEEKLYSIPEYNAKLIATTKTKTRKLDPNQEISKRS
jgi:hypothetical protein